MFYKTSVYILEDKNQILNLITELENKIRDNKLDVYLPEGLSEHIFVNLQKQIQSLNEETTDLKKRQDSYLNMIRVSSSYFKYTF